MSFSDWLKLGGWAIRFVPAALRLLRSDDGRLLIAGVKELSDDGVPQEPIHEVLKKAGFDTERLAREIHPVGPQPEGPGLGANP